MENDRVRVLGTRIAPGDKTPVHTHRWPSVLYVVSSSDFLRHDQHGNLLTDSRKQPSPQPAAIWVPPMPPHSVENIGASEIHLINVEWKAAE
jgi:quercetin dioxygenase-like cupin family protein